MYLKISQSVSQDWQKQSNFHLTLKNTGNNDRSAALKTTQMFFDSWKHKKKEEVAGGAD